MKIRKPDKISRLAHDMRSALTSVKEGISLVSDGTLGKINKNQKTYLSIAESGIKKMVNLIDRVHELKTKK